MSATSVKIYGNDMALDVKEDFVSLYGIGKSVEDINQYILSYQPDDEDEDACSFWGALALVEWEYGVLTNQIRSKTKEIIENHSDAFLFIKKEDQKKRIEELKKLVEIINTINPNPKKRKKTFIYRTEWKQGDILAIPISNKYVYLHICAVSRSNHKIKELEEDSVFVRVFDRISDNLLNIKDFKSGVFHKIKYMNLDKSKQCTLKCLWCIGIREKKNLESKVINIGNLPTKYEVTGSVYADFQFCKVENTLAKMFELH